MSTKVSANTAFAQGWEERFRDDPALDWIWDYSHDFDSGNMRHGPHSTWHSDNFVLTKSDGTVITGGAAGWAALLEIYAPLPVTFHEPIFYIAWPTDTGYMMFGVAKLFAKLPVPGEQTKTDLQGRKWDVEAPGGFLFELEKDPAGPKGMKLKREWMYSDGMPIIGEMVKRGMVTAEQLMGGH